MYLPYRIRTCSLNQDLMLIGSIRKSGSDVDLTRIHLIALHGVLQIIILHTATWESNRLLVRRPTAPDSFRKSSTLRPAAGRRLLRMLLFLERTNSCCSASSDSSVLLQHSFHGFVRFEYRSVPTLRSTYSTVRVNEERTVCC